LNISAIAFNSRCLLPIFVTEVADITVSIDGFQPDYTKADRVRSCVRPSRWIAAVCSACAQLDLPGLDESFPDET
jgi:hypothetical protein